MTLETAPLQPFLQQLRRLRANGSQLLLPRVFGRSVFPDAWMTTPKQLAFRLERYAGKHPDLQLAVFEIPQVPGYRLLSRSNKSVAESLSTTAYAVPIAVLNPYLAGGIFVDYLVRGRYHPIPKDPLVVAPEDWPPQLVPPLTDTSAGRESGQRYHPGHRRRCDYSCGNAGVRES